MDAQITENMKLCKYKIKKKNKNCKIMHEYCVQKQYSKGERERESTNEHFIPQITLTKPVNLQC